MRLRSQQRIIDGLGQPTVEKIATMFREHGASMYAGEAVTQLEHALQAAYQAENQQAPQTLVVAAVLHDLGHLMHASEEDYTEQSLDDEHEALAAQWLDHWFPPEVVEPIRLHVPAKRYLCTVDKKYMFKLSEASQKSLELQGGRMSIDETSLFEQHPYFRDALRLRGWDESAKIPSLETPPFEHYLPSVAACLRTT